MYMDPAAFALALLATGGLGVVFAGILFMLREVNRRLDEVDAMMAKRRHTYPTANGLKDALAVTINLLLEEEAQSAYRDKRLRQVQRILGEVRQGPLAYDSERPAERPAHSDSGRDG